MFEMAHQLRGCPLVIFVLAGLAGCSSAPRMEVPIVDRSPARAAEAAKPAPRPTEAKDGFYVVQRGDTLYSIALAQGRDWRDLARWNGIDDPAKIRVGQTLRVAPAPTDTPAESVAATVPVAPPSGSVQARPLDGAAGTTSPAPVPSPVLPPPVVAAPPPGIPTPAPAKPPPVANDSGIDWLWPAKGPVLDQFNEARNKGIDIGGKEGDPVIAASDGQVVYVGSGLRGYGNLVIVKHNDEYVSAYAHNREVLVKQGDSVRKGQKLAVLGASDADRPKLHFEIRRQGKPVDPLKLLPPQ
jgi:lipoprotein NlpD